jgi:diadenosine tetraphosphate (Ap4A) HIT family hydrolase
VTERDRDATDFRRVGESYAYREPGCAFCEMPKDPVEAGVELAYAVHHAFPVTSLHTLTIYKRHVSGYFELGRAELHACHRLLDQEKGAIKRADASVEGFNYGVNDGEAAGKTVFHCHIHLTPPRRTGDVVDPTGVLGTSCRARAHAGDEPVIRLLGLIVCLGRVRMGFEHSQDRRVGKVGDGRGIALSEV